MSSARLASAPSRSSHSGQTRLRWPLKWLNCGSAAVETRAGPPGGTAGGRRGQEQLARRVPQGPQRHVGPVDDAEVRQQPLAVEAAPGVAHGHRRAATLGGQRTAGRRLARERLLHHRVQVAPLVDDEQLGPLLERRRDEAIPTCPQVGGGRRHDPGAAGGDPTRGPHQQVVERGQVRGARRAGPDGRAGRPGPSAGGTRTPRRPLRARRRIRRRPRPRARRGRARARTRPGSSATGSGSPGSRAGLRLRRLGLVRVVERPRRHGRLGSASVGLGPARPAAPAGRERLAASWTATSGPAAPRQRWRRRRSPTAARASFGRPSAAAPSGRSAPRRRARRSRRLMVSPAPRMAIAASAAAMEKSSDRDRSPPPSR